MTLKTLFLAAAAFLTTAVGSQAQYIFVIGDRAQQNPGASDTERNVWPSNGNENPPNAIDGNVDTKYLNFGRGGTGYIFTPNGGAAVVTGIQFATANDAPERDPASFILLGSNTVVADPTPGTIYQQADFTTIAEGTLSLPEDRKVFLQPDVTFNNDVAYNTFLLIFPTIKNADTANSMQIAEAALLTAAGPLRDGTIAGGQLAVVPEPGATVLLGGLAVGLLARRRRA